MNKLTVKLKFDYKKTFKPLKKREIDADKLDQHYR